MLPGMFRGRLIAGAALASAALAGPTVAGAATQQFPSDWPTCTPRTAPIHTGITGFSQTRHGRLITLMLHSRAMGDIQPVDVLLPSHYDSHKRYHVLYLLHGAGGSYQSWINTGIEQLLGSLPVIAVMPDGSERGMDGGYSDWFGTAPGQIESAPAWESYHIDELLPFIDQHFPTIKTAAGRAIVGISMGGGGATKYAAEYPGTFGYVGTLSGESDPLLPAAVAFQSKTCKWGDPNTQLLIWRDNDSTSLAANLKGVRIFIRCGDGTPGPFDYPTEPSDPTKAAIRRIQLIIEAGAHLENEDLATALRAHGIHDIDVRYFPGSHSLPYWQRDTRELVSWLRAQSRHPPRTPPSFTVASAHTNFTAWGWSFHAIRKVREFVYLRITRTRITATGSGRLEVRAPPSSRPHRSFTINLGPSHTHQQNQFGPQATRHWRTVTATLER
jgi:S-formylglutathione hydrolase FrmB